MFGQSLLSAFGSAACTTDTDQLFPATTFQSVATYQLNGNVNDLTGNYNGTQSGGTWETNGEFLGCWNSDGVSDEYLQASQPPNVKTVSAWVYVTGTPSNSVGAIVWTNGASSAPSVSYLLGLSDAGKIYAFGSYVGLTRTVTLNQWYHVAATYNAGTVKIYWEGTHVETRTTPFPSVVNGTQITIGRSNYAGNVHNFNGSIDQIRIYDKTLTSADITTLYNETVATSSTNITFEGYNGIAYYKMSDATDQLGNYNGTATDVNFNTVGKFGFAGAFNGSSSYIDTTYNFGTDSSYSISLWEKTSVTSTRQGLFGVWIASGSNNGPGINFGIDASNNFEFMIANGSSNWSDTSISASSYTDGNWHNLILVINGTSVKLYADGNTTPIANLTSSVSAGTSTSNNLALGRLGNYPGLYFNGSIDQVRIYDSALSAANVTTLYNEIECPAVAVTNAFNTVLYTGNGSIRSITGVGFEPDLVWIKKRSSASTGDNMLFDSVRGVDKVIISNSTQAEYNGGGSGYQTSFDSDGFSITSNAFVNQSSATYVAWNWKAGGTAVSNTDGTITSQVSANTDAGFSITKYTGNGISGATFGHALGKQVEISIVKNVGSSGYWYVYSNLLPTNNNLYLNTSDSKQADGVMLGGNSTTVSISASSAVNTNNGSYIAYNFTSIPGYSKVGSYTGTGATGNVQYVGFEPAFLMIKNTTGGSSWVIFDNKRNPSNPKEDALFPNLSSAEYTFSNTGINFLSNSFSLISNPGETNGSGQTYIFLAIK